MARQNSRTYRYSSTAYVNTNAYAGNQKIVNPGYPMATAKSASSRYTYNARDRLREIQDLRYSNTFLSQERVDQIFGVDLDSSYCREDGEEICEAKDDFYYKSPEELEEGFQYSLPLESVDEVEAKLVRAIKKYREATAKMAGMALLWHDLMEDLEDNPHLQEAFDRFHMLRKLSGGNC